MLYDWLDGVTSERYGLDPALANLSPRQAKAQGLLTSGTFGLPGIGSSKSAVLKSCLESKLIKLLPGSTLFSETWNRKATAAGQQLLVHTALARRTSGSESTGWPTATVNDSRNGANMTANRSSIRGRLPHSGVTLVDAVRVDWPTPTLNDTTGTYPQSEHSKLKNIAMKSWATPAAQEAGGTPEQFLARKEGVCGVSLTSLSLQAQTASGGQLNPALSRWLMGYPEEWDSCGATAMRSFLRVRRRS